MTWDYKTPLCYYETKCKLCDRNDHWVLNIYDNQHHWLENGLKQMGKEGWELVAVQQTYQAANVGIHPSFWYIFKKPLS